MRVSIVGTGHVGLVTAASLAHLGHEVLGVDDDAEKVATIARGETPFHEPGLQELLREGLDAGRLRVSPDVPEAARFGEVVFICVGTPTKPTGEANLVQVERVSTVIARALEGYTVIAEKSTVPVETGVWVRRTIELTAAPDAEFDVASNPEFLREGRAVHDTLNPDRIVVGTSSARAMERLRELYAPILDRTGCPFVVTDLATAELIKHASNAFLATKVSFINAIADICERTGADVHEVARAMGLDPRIGPAFLGAGIGYGGACLPKDVAAFRHKADELGVGFPLLEEVERVNMARRERFIEKIRSAVWNLEGKRIAMWGLAFKPDTDDLRNAPAIEIARRLSEEGADVVAYDPVAMPASKPLLFAATFAPTALEAAQGADCLAICTEWEEFRGVDLERLRDAMARPAIVDGRNMFDPPAMADAGFTYASMGRPTAAPAPGP
ncbi:MAG: UDP-glucose/GDP-mannose dehydrogenase family protein [Actinobacteria bacterium]|nr:UDP-glucose/GDP-mannose dehydrogenase family protein [Actinomycetota bacterium]